VGRLRLCAPRAAIQEVLAPVLIDYLVSYPRMQVEVEELELMPRLIEDGFDPYTAEQYIDMQFQNVMPAYLNANCIVDNILNITKVLDEI
jgi:hypothetical protein